MHVSVGVEKLLHAACLVGRQVVRDDMDLFPTRLTRHYVHQKSNELFAGVTVRCLAENLSRPGVQGRVQGKGPMPVVLEPMAFRASWGEGQDRIEAIQGLDGCLRIHAKTPRRAAVV